MQLSSARLGSALGSMSVGQWNGDGDEDSGFFGDSRLLWGSD